MAGGFLQTTAEEKSTLEADVGDAKKDREEAKEAGDYKMNLDALTKAIAALEKGMAGGFLQTTAATVLRTLSLSMDMSSSDRDMLASFLTEKAGYVPQSGEIT